MRIICFLLCLIVAATVVGAENRTYKEYINSYYPIAIKEMPYFGIYNRMAEEVAQYALARQVLEDGLNREDIRSCPGIKISNVGGDAMAALGLIPGQTYNEMTVETVRDSENSRYYMIKGCNANIYGMLAVVYMWDRDILDSKAYKSDEKAAWILSKELSGSGALIPRLRYYLIRDIRQKVILKANRRYGGDYRTVEFNVKKYKEVFDKWR